eukprot:TRINITY_DN36483_c0_g1_i1.p1 TRINITY_DN36483_c0_g1~~TRINITY_DN36483_c0_g1_i1.p1  ORF type:complete len:194 (-),score=38.49 TRINITY_DN36483_c0_g1_i1:264-845(-)
MAATSASLSSTYLPSTSIGLSPTINGASQQRVCLEGYNGNVLRLSRLRLASGSDSAAQRHVVAMAAPAGGVEPDLAEEKDLPPYWSLPGEELDADGTFPYGKVDGAHSYHKPPPGNFVSRVKEALEEAGGPTGAQVPISYGFLPALIIMVLLDLPMEYYVGLTVVFLFAFIGLEQAKPEREIHLEPKMYRKGK